MLFVSTLGLISLTFSQDTTESEEKLLKVGKDDKKELAEILFLSYPSQNKKMLLQDLHFKLFSMNDACTYQIWISLRLVNYI